MEDNVIVVKRVVLMHIAMRRIFLILQMVTLESSFELVEAGDERCVKELQQYMLYLAVTINNLYNILDCDVILGGYVGGYMEKYLDERDVWFRRDVHLLQMEALSNHVSSNTSHLL